MIVLLVRWFLCFVQRLLYNFIHFLPTVSVESCVKCLEKSFKSFLLANYFFLRTFPICKGYKSRPVVRLPLAQAIPVVSIPHLCTTYKQVILVYELRDQIFGIIKLSSILLNKTKLDYVLLYCSEIELASFPP